MLRFRSRASRALGPTSKVQTRHAPSLPTAYRLCLGLTTLKSAWRIENMKTASAAIRRLVLQHGQRIRRPVHSTSACWAKKARRTDESTLAGAQHKPSLSGPSFGHLISELSATRPGMGALRQEGHTMSEEHRTMARTVAKYVVGLPLAVGTIIVGAGWLSSDRKD